MHELVAFIRIIAIMSVWQFSSRLDLYFYAYIHHLIYGLYLSTMNSDAASVLLILMAASGFGFDAVDMCYRESNQVACRESISVGSSYILLMLGVHCSLKMRELLYPRTNKIAA